MKKHLIVAVVAAALAVCLVPRKITYDDGGTVRYKAVLYSITDYNISNYENGYEGRVVKILKHFVVYDTTKGTGEWYPD